jgi:hypothetical protein
MKDDLRLVEISNQAELESRLVVDTDSGPVVTFGFVLPFLLIAVTICGSFVLPPRCVRFSQSGALTSAPISESLTQISPWVGWVAVSLHFPNLTAASFQVAGVVNVSASRRGARVFALSAPLRRAARALDGGAGLLLFATDVLTFDTLSVTVAQLSCGPCQGWLLSWDLEAPLSSMVAAITRILFVTLLIPYLVVDVVQFTADTSFERRLSAIFTVFTVAYIDPFFIDQLFVPSLQRQISHLVLRDLYFAALAFYTIVLFAFFTPHERLALNLGFPAALALVVLVGLLVQDLAFAKPHVALLLPSAPLGQFDRLTVSHCFTVALLCVVLIVRAIQVGAAVTDLTLLRYRYYTIAVVTFLVAFLALICFEVFTDRLEDVRGFLTTAVVTGFALFVEFLHSEAEWFPYGEYPPKGGVAFLTEAEVELGADEDSDRIQDGQESEGY